MHLEAGETLTGLRKQPRTSSSSRFPAATALAAVGFTAPRIRFRSHFIAGSQSLYLCH